MRGCRRGGSTLAAAPVALCFYFIFVRRKNTWGRKERGERKRKGRKREKEKKINGNFSNTEIF
jgi:hypothetical protein